MAADAIILSQDESDGPTLADLGIVYLTNSTCTEDWYDGGPRLDTDCISATKAYGQDNISMLNAQGTSPPFNIGASTCTLTWCVQDFNTSVTNGQVSEAIETNQAMFGTFDDLLTPVYIPNPCYVNGTPLSLDQITDNSGQHPKYHKIQLLNDSTLVLTVRSDCIYSVDYRFNQAVQYFLSIGAGDLSIAAEDGAPSKAFLGGNANLLSGDELDALTKDVPFFSPFYLEPFFASGKANLQSINATFASIAGAMTNWIRAHGNGNDAIDGTAYANQSCVKITWPWLVLPAVVTLATCLLLTIVIIKSKELGDACTWKSSPFAPMLNDLSEERKAEIGESLATGKEFEQTNRVKVMLQRVGDGLRLKEE
jgi:hypothetical protein